MLRLLRAAWLIALVWIAPASIAAEVEPQAEARASAEAKTAELDVVRVVELPATRGWSGMQTVSVDRKGRVYVLRSETLEVYPLDDDLRPVEPVKLRPHGLDGPRGLRAAAMGDDPEDWLLVGQRVHWFVDGKEVAITAPDQPALTPVLRRGDPVLLLGPHKLRRDRGETFEELPTLAEWSGSDWDSILEEPVGALADASGPEKARARHGLLAVDEEGRLWLAQVFTPSLRQISAGGRVLLEIETGDVVDRPKAEESVAAVRRRLGREQVAPDAESAPRDPEIQVMRSSPVHRGLTAASDGHVYLLAESSGGRQLLQRWNSIEQRLEEVEISLDLPGLASLALGDAGLVIGQFDAAKGLYLVPSEELAEAAWHPLDPAPAER